ncbi:ABC transporter permease [Undibacterium squillarum]|uniref:Peptide ABC transporter permease n=1 Tax=Undibacterium squillarum TaxID=1131567 RepID=A0ABQ2XVF4_9BURK|nr:ABC transporter permease [Undibacterium squillarum]GGX35614.1 peptide ABC transporter permease [Undibacterium squillarum]
MWTYLLNRLAVNIPTLFAILVVVFVLMNMAPGDPVDAFVPPTAVLTDQQKEVLRHELGLDQPLPLRFVSWLQQVAHGELGLRYKDGSPVLQEIARRAVPTGLLTVAGLGMGALLGVLTGLISARAYRRWPDHVLSVLAYISISSPAFLVGIIAMYVFALQLGWFPSGGYTDPGDESWRNILYHLAMPAMVLSLQFIGILMRYTRAGLLETMSQDYVRTARAKGLNPQQVLFRHAFPNTLIPIITVIGANFSALIGGAVFIETVFSWPGMGMLFLDGIESRDYPLIMGITLVMAVVILFINMLTDLIYSRIDPRITLR